MMTGFQSIQIEFPRSGDKKVVIDGKELDLSRLKSIRVDVDYNGIDVEVEMSWQGLPYKE